MAGIKYSLAAQSDTTNLIDYSTWVPGLTAIPGHFSRNGLEQENLIVSEFDPFGETTPVWKCYNTDVDSNGDGGFNTLPFSIDNTKLHRFTCWFKHNGNATVDTDGRYYFGCNGFGTTDGVYLRSDGSGPNTNPYFNNGYLYNTFMDANVWHLLVAFVFPAGSGTGANHSDSGYYTIKEGLINSSMYNYVWHADSTTARTRSYKFYDNNPSADVQLRMVYPRVEVVDGSEPSVEELLYGWGAESVSGNDSSQGNFYFRTSGDMGQTGGTGYYSTISPPAGGYTLYKKKNDYKGPAIYTPDNDAAMIFVVNQLSGNSFTTIGQVTTFLAGDSDYAYVAG